MRDIRLTLFEPGDTFVTEQNAQPVMWVVQPDGTFCRRDEDASASQVPLAPVPRVTQSEALDLNQHVPLADVLPDSRVLRILFREGYQTVNAVAIKVYQHGLHGLLGMRSMREQDVNEVITPMLIQHGLLPAGLTLQIRLSAEDLR